MLVKKINSLDYLFPVCRRWPHACSFCRRLSTGTILRLKGLRVEDMYVWPTLTGGCNMLVHVQSGKLSGAKAGGANWVSALFHAPVCNTTNWWLWNMVCLPLVRCLTMPFASFMIALPYKQALLMPPPPCVFTLHSTHLAFICEASSHRIPVPCYIGRGLVIRTLLCRSLAHFLLH